jgi:hypothetical protein
MRRLVLLPLFLLLAAPATAKEMGAIKACGSDRCIELTNATPDVLDGRLVKAPDHAEPFVEVVVEMRVEGGEDPPPWRMWFLPQAGMFLQMDNVWLRPDPGAAATLRDAAAKLELRPAKDLLIFAPDLPLPEAAPAARTPLADDGSGVSVPLLAGLAGAALLVALTVVGMRRRWAAAP